MSETVPATEFKARCLELMDRVAEGRETYIITKRGRAVAKLVPADPPQERNVFGCMADLTESVADLDDVPSDEEHSQQLEQERAAQWNAWESEWRRRGTVSGEKPAGKSRRKKAKR